MRHKLQALRIVIAGHVDHGKSTLIGRLLNDTDSLPDGKIAEIEASCKARNVAFEWSFVLDAFQAERDQAVTIESTQVPFKTAKRAYVIIDAPGHQAFLNNMISGAAQADAAILMVDATEGVQEQTRRHAHMLKLLGLDHVIVVINKMDKAAYEEAVFLEISKQVESYLNSINIKASAIIPVSARHGENIAAAPAHMEWYGGQSVVEALDSLEIEITDTDRPLRFPVQDVYRQDEKRIVAGRIESGSLSVGQTIFFSPTNEQAVVASIESWPGTQDTQTAQAGQSVGITLDQPVFVERGDVGASPEALPVLSNIMKAQLFWLSDVPLKVGDTYRLKYTSCAAMATIQSIDSVLDIESAEILESCDSVRKNTVCEVKIRTRDILPLDDYKEYPRMGRFVLYDPEKIVGGGTISLDGCADQRATHEPKSANIFSVHGLVTPDMRADRQGHRGGVFWFTGLSGAGKSTLAVAVEQALFERGYSSYVLDGDNVRHGLNRDLGFSDADRTENIRRIGEVAALMSQAGLAVVTAFISPFQEDRDRARLASPHSFHEIYIKADLQTCEARDTKGLYKKARAGEIKEFTGIDSPYEAPVNPDLIVETQAHDIQTCVDQIVSYIEGHIKVSKT